jgi:pyrroloquinoline quinone biosynthesis protein B
MIIKVLGSAAGGGFPQWNCNCRMCAAARAGTPGFKARTQSSLAISANGIDWALLNASPDLRQQINETPELGARTDGGLRHSPIKAVLLTNADVDHIAGLLNLREGQKFSIYGSDRVLTTLAANSVFNVVNPANAPRIPLPLDKPLAITGADFDLGFTVEAFAVPGKIALFLENAAAGSNYGSREGDTIGLEIKDTKTGATFFYIPGCAELDPPLAARIKGAGLIFFDGTLFTDDEMVTQGLSQKTGQRMGHISMSGPQGSMAAFEALGIKRRIYVHMNNSNPALEDGSDARRTVEASGWDVGFDGMEIRL